MTVEPPSTSEEILYVDADREAAIVLAPLLERAGRLRTASSIAAAREQIAAQCPSLIVLDPDAPGGDAVELLREVHAREPWVQIFVVCAAESVHKMRACISAGARDIAVKPFDAGTLLGRVSRLLRDAAVTKSEHAYRRGLEKKLRHAERIAVLGTLCATVAHEIATPLTAVSMNAKLLAEATRQGSADVSGSSVADLADDVVVGCRMIEAVLDRIRSFSRQNDEPRTEGSLGDVVDTALLLLKPRILEGDVVVTRRGSPPSASHYPTRLTQALLNLVKNAIEAQPAGAHVAIEFVEDERTVGIAVEDAGPGMPEALRGARDTAFLTTKVGGTGIGLMMVRSVMSEHGGALELEPRRDGRTGLRATLRFPRHPARAIPAT